jgi:lipopolysaccharide biosynthesis glycosyltransferase
MQAIHLALSFSQDYINPFYVFLTSAFKNTKSTIVFHTIIANVTPQQKAKLSSYVEKNGCQILFYDIDKSYDNLFIIPNGMSHFVKEGYYRLFFPALIDPEIKKLIYIDADTLILQDLTPLYNYNTNSKPIAAAPDKGMFPRPELGTIEKNSYFNSGVMVIDTEEWRKQEVFKESLAFLRAYPEKIIWADQDVLNAVLLGNWQKLDYEFNFMRECIPVFVNGTNKAKLLASIFVLHFNGPKPWEVKCDNLLRSVYAHYHKLSPVAREPYYGKKLSKSEISILAKNNLKRFYFSHPSLAPLWNSVKRIISR